MRYGFIQTNAANYSVEKMCKVLKVSKNSYYKWLASKDKTPKTNLLKKRINALFYENEKRYGSMKIKKRLEREGVYYSSSWVAHLMKQMGLRSIVREKFKATTDSKHQLPIYPNLLDRNFHVQELGKVWVSDITYIKVNQS